MYLVSLDVACVNKLRETEMQISGLLPHAETLEFRRDAHLSISVCTIVVRRCTTAEDGQTLTMSVSRQNPRGHLVTASAGQAAAPD
jgi:hypothetical protein